MAPAHQDQHDTATQAPGPDQGVAPVPSGGVEDLAEIIQAYNQVTDKLQHSHEALQGEVLRLRKELASADAQLQRSKRLSALGEMAAGIAHEVRNPLAAIQLYASMIAQDLQDAVGDFAEPLGHARKISDAVRGLDGIVGDVLSFAREIKPNPVLLPVEQVFDRAVHAHRPAIESSGVTVIQNDDDLDGLTVYADPDLIHQALLNLIRNAVDAMQDIHGPRELALGFRLDEAGVTLSVTDTGPGIDAQTIDRLFNPFFTTRATGTGLGLAIVHRIVDAHGGAVCAGGNPTAQTGASFGLTLPVPEVQQVPASKTPVQTDRRLPVGACA